MKLLVDARKMSKNPSGIGMYIYNFIREIVRYSDIEILIITDVIESEEIKSFHLNNIKIYNYGKYVSKTIEVVKYFKYIQKVIDLEKPDLFWEPNNVMAIKLKNKYGKIITTIHDIFPITNPEHHGLIFRNYYKYTLKRSIKNSDILIYVSKETKYEVEKRFNNANRKISHISYNIVNVLPKMTISDKGYFLYIGNIETRKGVDILIQAYDKYIKNNGENKLIIAGAVRDNTLKEMMNKINGIEYVGYVTNYEKAKLMSECTAFIFPSKAEGFGIPPVEAISYCKPLILSNLSIFKEILGENVNYFDINCDKEQQINNLFEAMKDIKKFSVDNENYRIIANKYKAEYRVNQLIKFLSSI